MALKVGCRLVSMARLWPVAAALVAGAALTLALMASVRPASAPAAASRVVVHHIEGLQLTTRPGIAVSPDGARVAFVTNRTLYVKELGDAGSRMVTTDRSERATPVNLVFSPQGTAIAYYDNIDSAIRQVDLTANTTTTVCRTLDMPAGLTWSGDFIYFTSVSGIMRVPAAGGSPELVIGKDPGDAVTRPQVLADGRLLFSLSKREGGTFDRWVNASVVVQRPGEAQPTIVVEKGSDPRYLASGHLIYVAGGVLYARRFDPVRLTAGPPAPMVEGVFRSTGASGGGLWWYGVSDTGALVYRAGATAAQGVSQLAVARFDRAGGVEATQIPPGPNSHPRLSPDGQRIAFGVDNGRDVSVWMYDIASGASPRRLTAGGRDRYPIWLGDSERVIFQSDRAGDLGLYSQAALGADAAARLTTAAPGTEHIPLSASPDGSFLLFDETKNQRTSLRAYSFKDKSISSYGNIESTLPTGAMFSPNGRWVAYASRAEGRSFSVVMVEPFPATGVKYQISPAADDGHHPVWSGDGRELFYMPGPGATFSAVSVNTTAPVFAFGPAPAFPRLFLNLPPSGARPYDIARNAKGEPVILGLTAKAVDPAHEERNELRIVLNWIEELKTRVK